jgi:hypothetical protein
MPTPATITAQMPTQLKLGIQQQQKPYFYNFKAAQDRFPTWCTGTRILFDVPARQASWNRFLDSLHVQKFWLSNARWSSIEEATTTFIQYLQ